MKVKLFVYSNKNLEEYFHLEKEFKFMEDISYYIKNEEFLQVLKKNCLIDNFTQQGFLRIEFKFANLRVIVNPIMILKNQRSENN